MRWIPSKSDKQQLIYPTRPAQRSAKGCRPLVGRNDRTERSASFFCVQLIDCGGVVLDFEACALVVGGRRHFLELRQFAAATVLLMAEGDPVSVRRLASICEVNSPNYRRDIVNRIVRQLNMMIFEKAYVGSIQRVAGGYSFIVEQMPARFGSELVERRVTRSTPRSSRPNRLQVVAHPDAANLEGRDLVPRFFSSLAAGGLPRRVPRWLSPPRLLPPRRRPVVRDTEASPEPYSRSLP